MSEKKIEITAQGLKDYKEELRYLIDVKKPEVIEKLQNARAMGDLSENADYDAARNEQGQVEARIKELEYIINNAKVVEVKSSDKNSCGLGKTVTFERLDKNKKITVSIVSSQETDALTNPDLLKISNQSPIGISLEGHKVGDVVTVKTAKGQYEVKVLSVEITEVEKK